MKKLYVKNIIFRTVEFTIKIFNFDLFKCCGIPVNIRVAGEKFNVPDRISSFTVPLGSQINSDGSVILFIAQMNGIDMNLAELLKIVLLGTIFSLGGSNILQAVRHGNENK